MEAISIPLTAFNAGSGRRGRDFTFILLWVCPQWPVFTQKGAPLIAATSGPASALLIATVAVIRLGAQRGARTCWAPRQAVRPRLSLLLVPWSPRDGQWNQTLKMFAGSFKCSSLLPGTSRGCEGRHISPDSSVALTGSCASLG